MKTKGRRIKANIKYINIFKWEGRKFVEKTKEIIKKEDWSIGANIGRYKKEKGEAKISISTMYRYAREYDEELEKMLLYKS